MRKHPTLGCEIAKSIPFLEASADIVYAHHEHYDGSGYPRGLKGEEIPLGARIFAVADAYDAMTSDRPYRDALGHDYAVEEVRRCAGTQFDPQIVQVFLKAVDKDLIGSEPQKPLALVPAVWSIGESL